MSVRTISPADVQAIIASGRPVDLIDVRTGLEFNGAHAVGARHAPLSGLEPAAVLANRLGAADEPVYIICKSGSRSASACTAFINAGFSNVFSVAGGTDAWVGAGLPTERNAKAASMGLLRQVAIMGAVLVVILFLMPCSPLSLWGGAWCPSNVTASASANAPSVPGSPAGVSAVPAFDFARDVVAASSTTPVLVDFHATWCGPCKMLGPELAALASERAGRLNLVSIDVDKHRTVAFDQQVESIPDIRLWKDGHEIARFIGYRPRADVAAWIDAAVAGRTP
jgi:thioredoxin